MAYYCLHEFGVLPSAFLELSKKERAFITAAIQVKIDSEKKKQKELNRKKPKSRR